MILRDGRRIEHDLGPLRTFEPSMMKAIGVEPSGSGGWNRNMTFLFVKHDRPARMSEGQMRANAVAWRLENLERQRQLERERSARYRERRRDESQ